MFDCVTGRADSPPSVAPDDGAGHVYVDLDREEEFHRFVLGRGPAPVPVGEQRGA